jgi:magnesium transporter
MSRLMKNVSKKMGLSPGTLMFVGKKKTEKPRISIIDYDSAKLSEKEAKKIDECFPFKDTPTVTWLNIDGLHDTDLIDKIGKHYDIHPLVLEDILNTGQRPKIEVFDDYLFIVLKMLSFDEVEFRITSEQVSLIMGKNFVISFQEQPGDLFDPLRDRIRTGKGKIRKMNSDYLTYALLDIVIDYYFNILEKVGEKIEDFESALMSEPKPDTLNEIYRLKREVLFLRKSVWPLREAVNKLERSESSLIHKKTKPYLRDVYDHTIQIIDAIETSRDLLSGMLDLYLSSVSNKMNEVMKVLTIFAAIFIPLTFIAGIYGTNFEFIPELKWQYGYFAMWTVMIITTIGLLIFFRKKKWI